MVYIIICIYIYIVVLFLYQPLPTEGGCATAKGPQSSRRRRTQRRATGPLHDRPRDGMLFFLDIIDVRPQNWVLIRHDFNWDPSSKNARICQQSINLESYTSGLDDCGIKCFTGFTMKPIKASDNLHALFAHHDAEKKSHLLNPWAPGKPLLLLRMHTTCRGSSQIHTTWASPAWYGNMRFVDTD